MKESIQFSDEQVAIVKKENEELVQINNALEKEVYDLGQRVQSLKFDHDALEQYTRKFNVEGHGILECEDENLAEIIIKRGQKISFDIIYQDIDIVHQLYRKTSTTKPIIEGREGGLPIPFPSHHFFPNPTNQCPDPTDMLTKHQSHSHFGLFF